MKKIMAFSIAILSLISPPSFAERLTITQLGDLGGGWSKAIAINEKGQVIGTSYTDSDFSPILRRHAFLWTEDSGIVDLGTLSGQWSEAVAINDSGQIIGRSIADNGYQHAFLWTNENGIQDLGSLKGFWSWPVAINDKGQVVGESYFIGGNHAFFWESGSGMVDMGTLGGNFSEVYAINNKGQAIGQSASNLNGSLRNAFFWSKETGMLDIGTLGGHTSWPVAINRNGIVIGTSEFSPYTSLRHSFIWSQSNGIQDLGTLGGDECLAVAINDEGQIVGRSTISPNNPLHHAFIVSPEDTDANGLPDLWVKDEDGNGINDLMIDLGVISGNWSQAIEINNNGQVAGTGGLRNDFTIRHAFFWENYSGITDIDSSGGMWSESIKINENGQIIGTISDSANFTRNGFLWSNKDGFVKLGTLNLKESSPVDQNNFGQVVGNCFTGYEQSRAVLWMVKPEIIVDIDIKPDNDTNTVNIDSAGVLEVAILSSQSFDAMKVNPATVRLEGASVKLLGKGDKYLYHQEDINSDGLMDLVCQVYTNELQLETGETRAILEAETFEVTPIRGEDYLRIIPDH